MFKRGQVVQHTETNWIGVVTLDGADGLVVKWFEGRNGGGLVDRTLVMPIHGYAFEAALALGDTATALRLYREAQTALEPFAAYGRLQLRYPANAVFTIAYDREGREVILLFEDFTRAAEVHPNAVGRTRATKAQGGAGGIAEIAVGEEMDFGARISTTMSAEQIHQLVEERIKQSGFFPMPMHVEVNGKQYRMDDIYAPDAEWREASVDREYRVRYVTADGETCYARVLTASAEKAAALVRDAIRTATAIEVLTPDEVTP